jgi:CubicO group peptidase (beta-lactamase class C family)
MKCGFLFFGLVPTLAIAQQQSLGAVADRVFGQWTSQSPGCAVGVAQNGEVLLTRGYGMANLETATPITPETIFESGSVAKQFTASAILLLAADGKLNLDDPARKYVPELPEYPRTITIRHLLTHTSGLREWSNLVGLAGWPRGTRVHTQSDLLEYVTAQKALNYPVGDFYSYTNSGFALLETVVERVSGMPFAQFTRERIFRRLGLSHTSWRDDFTTIVPGRAQAYARRDDGWRLDMPFEDVIGPGGLLTTVGDWLKWNDALDRKALGANIVDSLEKQATLTSGRRIQYAMGLFVQNYRGVPEIDHSGSTGGYSTYLTRFPGRGLSIAVLCNTAGANATSFAHQLVDAMIPDLAPVLRPDTVALDPSAAARMSGVYRSVRTHEPLLIGVTLDAARGGRGGRGGGPTLHALRDGGYLLGNNHAVFEAAPNGIPRGLRTIQSDGDTVSYVFVGAKSWMPSPVELTQFAGRYHSSEIGTTYTARAENGRLILVLRGSTRYDLTPVYRDAFTAGGGVGTVWFTRAPGGSVNAMHVGASRLWDLVFQREK